MTIGKNLPEIAYNSEEDNPKIDNRRRNSSTNFFEKILGGVGQVLQPILGAFPRNIQEKYFQSLFGRENYNIDEAIESNMIFNNAPYIAGNFLIFSQFGTSPEQRIFFACGGAISGFAYTLYEALMLRLPQEKLFKAQPRMSHHIDIGSFYGEILSLPFKLFGRD